MSVSATTRAPRVGEEDGKHYHFINQEKFEQMVKDDKFLESARVHDFYYGTLREEVNSKLEAGFDVILEIDPQGAMQVKSKKPDAVLIFIRPPSLDDLKQRLYGRGTDSAEVIARRLKDAQNELEQASKYNYVIINDYIDIASQELVKIIKIEREKTWSDTK